MSLTRTIAHQTIIQIAAKIFSVVLGVLTIGFITRYLGQEGYGHYTTAISFVFFFAVVADLGLYFITITELGKPGVDAKEIFSNTFTIRICASLITMLAAAVIVLFFPYPAIVKQGVMIVTVSTLANLLDQLHVTIFQKHLKMYRVAIAEIVGKAAILAGSIIAIAYGASLLALLWVVAFGYVLHFFINFIGARRLLPYTLRVDLAVWKRILTRSWPVALSGLFVIIYFKMDTILLSLLRPAAVAQKEVGIYGAAYKVLEVLVTFPSVFLGLIMPQLAHAFAAGDRARFQRIFQKAFNFFSLITLPMVAVFLVLAEPIILLVAGPDFTVSAPVLKILIIATGIIYLTHLSVYGVVAIEQQRRMMPNYIIGAVGSVIAYLITIPRYSYFGAAWTTVAVELFIGIAATWVVWRIIPMHLHLSVLAKAACASVLMAAVIVFLHAGLWTSLAVGGFVYAAVLLLTKGITKAQIKEIMQLRTEPASPQEQSPS
ncbi:hypothetical protein A3J43_03740 [Candidatus Uhrbacteria bacterium RIFCSPHIGHO2_12_FULL_54_23]|uniref:Uncharacterized protein n=3 Tax=Candidatus Uhriibacteriota TaxID=1752732 RepID=A0A1F7UGJ5_9BACT|nr:MAG: hypothetical protein A3J43_03740 [Candidatus Uhrbacteria bacterium RIFCSPHIGHO2_12_FULL_54_23]OGL83526.1 MAG: hypothetical protein A3B36_01440 [Candidatus Uhrbacteria bacterium RIFCSPLOWO2_01_FULL_55_36]OGL89722.1 MAG: hypothetical protein A3J36_02755 [Candidatus Uhrbacteria bacterium RIFCSPLOWO2_02_FULL_54_37]